LKAIISSTEDIILILDKDLHLIEYYKSLEFKNNFIFAKLEDYIGKSINGIFPKKVASGIEKSFRLCIKNGKIIQFDFPYSISKENYWFDIRVVPIVDSNKDVIGLSVAIRDITQRIAWKKRWSRVRKDNARFLKIHPRDSLFLMTRGG